MAKLAERLRGAVGVPVRWLIPKNPWLRLLLFGIPILIVLAFLGPVIELLGRGIEMVMRILEPLLDNPIGRLLLLNLLLFGAAAVLWMFLREKYRDLRAGMVLRNHLDAVHSLLLSDNGRSRELFSRVARSRVAAPKEYACAVEDAKLKLARLALEDGDQDLALSWLTRVREKKLPRELQRSLVQLRAQAIMDHGELLDQSLAQELAAALKRFPEDSELLSLQRRLLVEQGALVDAADVQDRVLAAAPPADQGRHRQLLANDLLAAGEAAITAGDFKVARRLAKRARAVDVGTGAACLAGKILAAEGDFKAAVREWGAASSPEGLALLAELLDRHPGAVTPRELLEASANEGTLLLVAREYARAGDFDRALRAARRAARRLGPSPSVATILVEVLQLCGQHEEAEKVSDAALIALVAPPQGNF